MWLLLSLLLPPAFAEMPLPSYREVTIETAWREVNDLVDRGRPEEAIEVAQRFQRTVTPTAGMEYLIGLSYRFLQDSARAERHLQRSIEMDPDYVSPWSDLGEIYLVQGRLDEARSAFERVSELVPEGPGAAIGPRRLAEVAAHRQDPVAFEDHIREALRRGFSFREVAGLPNWQQYYADPIMHDSVVKMVTVYGERRVLETLAPD